MSAGFSIREKVFWGTNGAVEAYVEAMAAEAAGKFGPDDPLTVFFHQEREQFFTGKVVFLDEWAMNVDSRQRLLELLDAATTRLLHSDTFTEYGREWVSVVIAELRASIQHSVSSSAARRSADS